MYKIATGMLFVHRNVLLRAFTISNFPYFLATLHHMLLFIPHHTCYTIMPPKPVTTKPVRDAAVARRVPVLAPKRVIADFGTFPTSYLIKGKNSIPFHDAFGGATPTTPYIPTNANPPLTTDTTKARFNRSTPEDSVLNSASKNEDDDSLDSGSRKLAAIHPLYSPYVCF